MSNMLLKDFIVEYSELLDNKNFEEVFETAAIELSRGDRTKLIELLDSIGLNVSQDMTRIDGEYFSATDITKFVIAKGVTTLDENAFAYCSKLKDISIPDTVTSIGDWAFYGCNSLTKVFIPDSVTRVGRGVFYKCSSLTSITIPDSINSIGEGAFEGLGSDVVINFNGTKEQWKNIYNSEAFTNTYFTVNCLDGPLHKKKDEH